MVTPIRFTVVLGGVIVAYAWSLHAANQKLTTAALERAAVGGDFPVTGEVLRGDVVLRTRHFLGSMTSESVDSMGAL